MRAVNLIPAEQRSGGSVGAGRSGGAAYVVLGMVVLLALMALLYGIARHQVASRTTEAAQVSARAQAAQQQAGQLAPYTAFAALRQQRAQAVETLVDSRFDWAHVMHEFGRVLPSDASINSLDGTIGAAGAAGAAAPPATPAAAASSSTVASATPPGSVPTFTIVGCATSQAAVAQTLDRLRLIDGVSTVTLESSARASAGATAGGGGCGAGAPTFTAQILFQPLPAASAVTAAGAKPAPASAQTVAQSSSAKPGALR